MSPLRGEEFTGRSVEEAIERGLRSLGKKRTDVDIEILEKGKPANVLGIGGEDARVLLTFQEEESVQEPEPVVDEAEVPRRPDALRERDEESEDAASPALPERFASSRDKSYVIRVHSSDSSAGGELWDAAHGSIGSSARWSSNSNSAR